MFFWIYIFLVPAPKLYLSSNEYSELYGDTNNTLTRRMIEISKIDEKKSFYHFDPEINKKKTRPIIYYTILSMIFIVLLSVVITPRPHVGFPLIIAILITYLLTTGLWIWTNTISKNIYLDIQSIRNIYFNIKSLQLLSTFAFIEIIIILLGLWFKFETKKSIGT